MSQKIEKQIGANVRKLREQAGMIQDMLAANLRLAGCDMTRSAVAKIEVGQRHLYPDELILIRNILNVSYEELLHISD
jgi:transcriptional regulator with XRE-family HTH domain